jgi:predicted NUDIX family NTP pyrophosphohydrolase
MKHSAGIVLYRRHGDSVEVLLVHPGGPLFARKDAGAWSIPKGELTPGHEDPLSVARREFEEETGAPIDGPFMPLTPITQRKNKTVCAWAVEGDLDAPAIRSNTFTMEWPPRSGQRGEFPEVDRAEWFALDAARQKIVAGQQPLLDELERLLSDRQD